MTDIAITHPVERIARVLCAQDYSEKGEGLGSGRGAAISAAVSSHCDHGWREEIVRAAEVLRTLREQARQLTGTSPEVPAVRLQEPNTARPYSPRVGGGGG